MNPTDYFKKMLPYAEKYVTPLTNIPAPLVVSWWSWETDFGKNNSSIQGNNHAGIKNNSKGSQYNVGQYAGYKTLDDFAKDYARILLNVKGAGYEKVIETAKKTNDPKQITNVMNLSSYAEADYNINTIVERFNQAIGITGTYSPPKTEGTATNLDFYGIKDNIKTLAGNLNAEQTIKFASIGLAAALLFSLLKD